MKKLISVILSICLIFTIAPFTFADKVGNVYYIDSENGNDLNNGTDPSSAWKTLSKASDTTFSQGDKILLKAGQVFNGTFSANGNGTEDTPIIVSSYGNAKENGNPIIRTEKDEPCMRIHNVTGWTVDGVDFTAPNGSGVSIYAHGNGMTEYITVQNCNFTQISNYIVDGYTGKTPISISSSGATARVRYLHIKGCVVNECGYGISMAGLTREWSPELYESPEKSYNRYFVIEDCTFTNILYDAVIICSICTMVIRNCVLLNTCIREDYFTAPMWSHHADDYVIENCEIGGALNTKDGMAVDFDGWTTNATYQYIYSHDNVRFVQNCLYDNYTCNDNCTVRYCLSVNDNKRDNNFCQVLTSGSHEYENDELPQAMTNFKFYNNTIVNSAPCNIQGLKNAMIANNIFTGNLKSIFVFGRKHIDENGKACYTKFDGTMTNNCFWGTSVPTVSKNSIVKYPGFTGKDEESIYSYRLSANSPLIGKGITVDGNNCEKDFFGNNLGSVHSIGCYEGKGETDKADMSVFDIITGYINTVLGTVYNFIESCNSMYWIF